MIRKSALMHVATIAAIAAMSGAASAEAAEAGRPDMNEADKALSVRFEPRKVAKIQAGDFHFRPGQIAPVHTHDAPAVGYVAKGVIIAQVEGSEPQFLRAGDVFYEPAGPRIMRFDNASPTEEAIFIDVNLQQEGEPFIVFPEPPTEAIDRRAFPDAPFKAGEIDGVDIYRHTLQPAAKQFVDIARAASGYVAEGVVDIRVKGETARRLQAGEMFYFDANEKAGGAVISNALPDAPARVVIFSLHKPS